jgi:hypothetical protein
MGKFLKAAFFLRYPLAGLGQVPLNLLGLAAFGILGIAHPGFWLLGAAAEVAYLAGLTSSARFRRYVTAMEFAAQSSDAEAKRRVLIGQLPADSQQRLAALQKRSARVLELYEGQGVEGYVVDASKEALHRLQWTYLKLLLAKNYLKSDESLSIQQKLTKDVAALQKDLESTGLSENLRESKTATLQILRKRLDNLQRREQSLQEIEADLQRIEAQVELAVDDAAMKGKPQAVSASIDLVSQMLDSGAYSEAESPTIQELEDAYRAPPAAGKDTVPERQ